MINDYKEEVILAYQKKRETGDVSMNLLHPTPAKLRAECLIVYNERFMQKDENTIRAFFGSKGDSDNYRQRISRFGTDKFKPLKKFLTGKTTDSDEKNIHLLAWLIDFEPRPYQSIYPFKTAIQTKSTLGNFNHTDQTEGKHGVNSAIKPDFGNIAVENNSAIAGGKQLANQTAGTGFKEIDGHITGKNTVHIEKGKKLTKAIQPFISKADNWKKVLSTPKMKQIIASFMILIFASSGTYLFVSNINQQCMYWKGDHYEAVSCNQKIEDVDIIAMDTNKLTRLRKITRPDTLTQSSLGKVWYAKIDNEVEFYTSGGFHPEYTDRRIKPITTYIIDKYIKNDNIALQNQ